MISKEKKKLFKMKKPRLKVPPPKVMKTKKDYDRKKGKKELQKMQTKDWCYRNGVEWHTTTLDSLQKKNCIREIVGRKRLSNQKTRGKAVAI
jgi:hypothetical protein